MQYLGNVELFGYHRKDKYTIDSYIFGWIENTYLVSYWCLNIWINFGLGFKCWTIANGSILCVHNYDNNTCVTFQGK